MKRSFVLALLLPALACAGLINVSGPALFVSSDDPPVDAQTWEERISQPGVVWYQGFESADEVDAFRWTLGYSGGNDPEANGTDAGYVSWVDGGGPDGMGALRAYYPAGDSPNSVHWIRPFSPLNTGSGKSVDDPAANGSLTVRAWSTTDGGNQTATWTHGWYRHEDASGTGTREGHDFYLQIRVKMDPRRITGGNNAHTVGKFVWFSTTHESFADGEHVTYSYGYNGNQGSDKNYLRMYVKDRTGAGDTDPLNTGERIQENSESADDWYYSGGWDTLLYHIRPGDELVTSGEDSTLLEIWAANEGATEYTKIWEQEYGLVDLRL